MKLQSAKLEVKAAIILDAYAKAHNFIPRFNNIPITINKCKSKLQIEDQDKFENWCNKLIKTNNS